MKARGILLATVAGISMIAASQSSAHHQGWYVGLEAGANWIDDTSGIFARPGFGEVDLEEAITIGGFGFSSGTEFDTGWAGFATVGYGFEKNWRIELELGYRQNDADLTVDFDGPIRFAGDVTEWSAMINVIYDVPLTERLDLNLGLGAGVDHIELEASRRGTPLVDDNDTTFAFQAIAGLSYEVTNRLDLTLTYRYLNVSEPEFSAVRGTLELDDVEKHTVTIGLRYDLYADEAPLPPPPPPPPPAPAAPTQFIIYFGFDKCDISPEADGVLSEAASAAKSQGSVKVVIVGHTDTMGSIAYNQRLSECRANAAKTNLTGKGIDASAISTSGRGEGELLVKTDDSVKEPQNRRATIDLNK